MEAGHQFLSQRYQDLFYTRLDHLLAFHNKSLQNRAKAVYGGL